MIVRKAEVSDQVIACGVLEDVGAFTTCERVIAGSTREAVGYCITDELIVAGACGAVLDDGAWCQYEVADLTASVGGLEVTAVLAGTP